MWLGAGTDSLSTLGGEPRHKHIKIGRFYRPNIWPRGWRGEESSSPKYPPNRGGRCRCSRAGFCDGKGAGEQRNNKLLQSPECSPSPQELWDKQERFLNHQEWFRGSCDFWCCTRRRDNDGKALCSSKATRPELVLVSLQIHGQHQVHLQWTLGPGKSISDTLRTRKTSLFQGVPRKTESKAS